MTRCVALAALLVSFAPAMGDEALPPAWKHWRWSRPVELDRTDAAWLVRVELPLEVVGEARPDLADVRLLDGSQEVARVVRGLPSAEETRWRDVPLIDVGFVPGSHTQAVADLGPAAEPCNRIRIDTDRQEFFVWVRLEASDDRRSWRVLRARAPLLRFREGGAPESLTLAFPPTRSRWLRLLVLDPDESFPLSGCRVAHAADEPELVWWRPLPRRSADSPRGESRFEVDLAHPNVPVGAVRLGTDEPSFRRALRLAVHDPDVGWRECGREEAYRYDTGDPGAAVVEKLVARFTEGRGRRFRVTIEDGNDPPLANLRVRLGAARRDVVFEARPGETYRLIYGNPRAPTPTYDLERTTPAEWIVEARPVALGPVAENAGWVSPAPWSERHAWVLWVALVVAVVVLAALALRALR